MKKFSKEEHKFMKNGGIIVKSDLAFCISDGELMYIAHEDLVQGVWEVYQENIIIKQRGV